MASERRLKCRWCDYRGPRWVTRSDGTRRPGSTKAHAEREHSGDLDDVLARVRAEEDMDPLELPDYPASRARWDDEVG